MKHSNKFLVLSLLVLLPLLAFAQNGTIAGKVVDAKSGDPLPGASVLVQGLDMGAATNLEGEFTVANVPAGSRSIIARFIGYKSLVKVVNVTGGGIAELNFELSETALQLDEVVVTGTGIASEKRKLGNTVATVNSSQLENAPITTLSEVLQGREAGVSVLPSSGVVGEGARIRIRGSSSLSQSLEPIVYIDGVRMDNSGGFAGVGAGGGGVPSRLDDINPNAIERVEILKGAAAATLYGTQASNGIIQIFTKQGQFGKPRFTLEIEQSGIDYPDVYKLNAGFAHTDAQLANMKTVFNDQTLQLYQVVEKPFVKNLFSTGYGQTYSLGVSGGGSGVTYFASARYQNTNGPYSPSSSDFLGAEPGPGEDKLARTQFTATLNIVPSNKLNIRMTSGYSRVNQEAIDNNNNIYGVLSLAMFGKPERVVPLNAAGLNGNAQGTAAFATVREASFQETKDNTDHATVSLGTTYKMSKEISIDGTVGIDYVSQRSSNLNPFAWNVDGFSTFLVDGDLQIGKREHTEWTVDLKGSWNRSFTTNISSAFVAGLQGFITNETYAFGQGTGFPGPGIVDLEGGASKSADSFFQEIVQAGYFFQEQLGYKDYLYVTGGVRFDANSAFGSNFSTQAYPKLSLSFVPSTALNMSGSLLTTFRVRAAVGRSGQQPGAFDQFTTYRAFTSADGAGLAPDNLGDLGLKPELATEYEAGFEAGFLNDRLGLEFTYWDRTVKDALVRRAFPPSGGFYRTQLSNIGELKANGIDLEATFHVLKKENLSLEVFANGAYLSQEVTDLGGAPPQKSGGSYPRYRNFLTEGYAPGSFFGAKLNGSAEYAIDLNRDFLPETRDALLAFFAVARDPGTFFPLVSKGDDNHDGITDILDNYLGKPTPDWQGAFGFNLGFMKRFRFANLFEYKAGNFYVHNLTDEFRRFHAVIGRNTLRAAELEAVLVNPASTAEQRLTAADEWARNNAGLSPFDGLNAVEKADFIRWREVSLTYDMPRSVFSRFGVSNASISVAARNLLLISGYSGIDPELNAIGRGGSSGSVSGESIDDLFLDGTEAFGLPIPRQFVFTIRTSF
ncbi:MAG: SusC/RagA family TonB-linked outer membrane protein [candidate division KSB1 bacterium]